MEINTTAGDSQEIDILNELSQATQYKPESTSTPAPGGESIDAPDTAHTDDDFEAESTPPPAEDNDAAEDNTVNAEDLTELIMSASEMLLESSLPALYRSTIPKEDLRVMNELISIYKQDKATRAKVITFDERQQEVMEVYIDYTDYCKNLPLTTRETKNLRKALKKVLENVNFKASPENALMAVGAMILVPRTLPIAARKFFTKE